MGPKVYILVGVPGSGKTTWMQNQDFNWNRTVVASTDIFVEKQAQDHGVTYSDIFEDVMPAAVRFMAETVVEAVQNNLDIVWDQTSTTIHTRAKKLRMIPYFYKKIAVVFPTPDTEELAKRLASRPGKIIPQEVITNMIEKYEMPSLNEGFDEIIYIN